MIPSLLAATENQEVAEVASGNPVLTLFAGLVLIVLVFWFFASDRDRTRRNIGAVVMIATVIFSLLAIAPISGWKSWLQGEKAFSEVTEIKRGIDIAGGVSFVLKVTPVDPDEPVTEDAMKGVKAVIEKRLAQIGYSQPTIIIQPAKMRLEVQIPDADEAQAALVEQKITEVAALQIFKVLREFPRKYFYDESRPEGQRWNIERMREDLEDERLFPVRDFDKEGNEFISSYVATTSPRPVLEGEHIKRAYADTRSGKAIMVELTDDGADINREFTRNQMVKGQDRIAVVFDGTAITVPTQQADELGGEFQISGMKDLKEARRVADNMGNPLKSKPEVVEQRQISATLGEATINQGMKAGLIGLGLTLLFVVIYYRLAGLIALIGLSINILLIFGSMALMSATFTLPGIAGVILTIGVAIDANVLIYERLREERESGKSFADALRVAYEKAFSAIIDANITTLITAIILFAMASGSVKGFAVTLTIGIMGTLLAALVFTRVLFWVGRDLGIVKASKFLNLIPKNSINFLSKAKFTLTLSSILVLGGLALTISKGKDALGVDFTGGTNLEYAIPNELFESNGGLSQENIQAKLDTLKLSQAAKAQIASPEDDPNKYISIRLSSNPEEIKQVNEAFRSIDPTLMEKEVKEITTEENGKTVTKEVDVYKIENSTVGISASMGQEFLNNSLIALGLGLVGIMFYITIRFEFSFAVGAFCALFHDIVVVLGLIMLKGDEITMIHVGAFLTIAGYSINDTIVVFDRIRENLKYSESSITTVMNEAIRATLSRTILTSVTTFVAVLCLYILGGSALSEFSFTIMMGVIVGTYSSIFVAAPIVWLFAKARGKDLREEVITAQQAGEEDDFERFDDGEEEPTPA